MDNDKAITHKVLVKRQTASKVERRLLCRGSQYDELRNLLERSPRID